jgi:hypothetical protein
MVSLKVSLEEEKRCQLYRETPKNIYIYKKLALDQRVSHLGVWSLARLSTELVFLASFCNDDMSSFLRRLTSQSWRLARRELLTFLLESGQLTTVDPGQPSHMLWSFVDPGQLIRPSPLFLLHKESRYCPVGRSFFNCCEDVGQAIITCSRIWFIGHFAVRSQKDFAFSYSCNRTKVWRSIF